MCTVHITDWDINVITKVIPAPIEQKARNILNLKIYIHIYSSI